MGERPEERARDAPCRACFVHSRQQRNLEILDGCLKAWVVKEPEKARASHFNKTGILFLQTAWSPSRGHEGQARMSKNGRGLGRWSSSLNPGKISLTFFTL